MESLLPLLTDMVICPIILSRLLLREAWDIQPEGEDRDILVLVLLEHHPLHINIFMSYFQHSLDICCDAALVGTVAHKQEHHGGLCFHCLHWFLVDL